MRPVIQVGNYSVKAMTGQGGISQFLRNKKILITGSTGLVGKCLVEKLIRDAPDLNKLYLLIRPKKGESSLERSRKYFSSMVFERVRNNSPNLVQFVPGDLAAPECGLNAEDKELLMDVDIVLHSAADVSFRSSVQQVIAVNVGGTKNLLDLALNMKKIQSFVSISTAFSTPGKAVIEENVYPANLEPLDAIELFSNLPREWSRKLSKKATGPGRSPYQYSKQLSENLLQSYHGRLPVCIVRPAVVLAAISEPHPGWNEIDASISMHCKNIYNGVYHTTYVRAKKNFAVTPIDTLVNTTIAAAWRQFNMASSKFNVYNCVPAPTNYFSYQQFITWGIESIRNNPPPGLKYLPTGFHTHFFGVYLAKEVIFRFMPSLLYNGIVRLNPKESVKALAMSVISHRVMALIILKDWKFTTNNMDELNELMPFEDRERFPIDFRQIDWKPFVQNFVLGLFKFGPTEEKESLSRPSSITWLRFKHWSLVLTLWSPLLCISGFAWTQGILSL